jgi:hypothetical protein
LQRWQIGCGCDRGASEHVAVAGLCEIEKTQWLQQKNNDNFRNDEGDDEGGWR